MARAILVATALLAAAFAGCVTPPDDVDAAAIDPTALPETLVPAIDAEALLDEVKAFSEKFPMRRGDNAAHKDARTYLEKAYLDAGYTDVFQDEYHAPVDARSTPTNALGSDRLANVCAMKWGATLPQEWIVVGAHFDVTDGAIYGAYDDASGTMMVQHLARAFATIPTARTIVFCNFDGEEQGLTGSTHIVKAVTNEEWVHKNGTLVGMIDFDMAGINHPAAPPLVADVVSPEMQAIIAAKADALGIPADKVEYRPIKGGNSDNGPFKAAEIPSVLFISNFDDVAVDPVGSIPLVNYPFWHQLDTFEGMVRLAGGEDKLIAGTQNVMDIGAELLAKMASGMTLTFEAPK